MSEKVELKVDVINQFILLRNSTFKDKLSFVDENVQNAQRAKATTVEIITKREEKLLIIQNNGEMLKDPQSLFTIAESGWDEEVKETENPFGLGFFSNVTVSDNIGIVSGKWAISFPVDIMIAERDPGRIVIEEFPSEEDYYPGFQLRLNNFDFDTISVSMLQERAKLLGQYVQDIDVIFNGQVIKKLNLTEGDGNPDNIVVDEENIIGWLRIVDGYSSKLRVFYRGRFVKNLDLTGLYGDIHISDKSVNLTAPDRRDIIEDDKYGLFVARLKDIAKKACWSVIDSEDERKIDKLSSTLDIYIDPEDLIGRVSLLVLNGKSDEALLDDMKRICRENYIRTYSDMEHYLKQEKKSLDSITEAERNVITLEKEVDLPDIQEHNFDYGGGGYVTMEEKVQDYVDKAQKVLSTTLTEKLRAKFWLSVSDIQYYEKRMNTLTRYGLDVIIARNSLETSVLKLLSKRGRFIHISDIDSTLKVSVIVENPHPINKKEERAMMLLAWVSTLAGLDHNPFVLGDLKVMRSILVIGNEDIRETDRMEEVAVIKEGDKIYLDRSYLRDHYSRQDLSTKMSVQDYKFILANIDLLSEEIGLLTHEFKDAVYKKVIDGLCK